MSQMQTRNLKGSSIMAKVKQIRLNKLYFHHALSTTNRALCVLKGETSLAQDLPALVHKVQPWLKFGIKSRSESSDEDSRQLKGVGNPPNADQKIPEHQPCEPQSLPLQLEGRSNEHNLHR